MDTCKAHHERLKEMMFCEETYCEKIFSRSGLLLNLTDAKHKKINKFCILEYI